MRLAAMETVVTRGCGFYLIDLSEEGWTSATLESRWFAAGDELSWKYVELEDGMLMDRAGRLVLDG